MLNYVLLKFSLSLIVNTSFMKHKLQALLYTVSCLFLCTGISAQQFNYPSSPQQLVVDTIFGKLIADEYRWLEDVNNDKTKQWLKKQSAFTETVLKTIPGRDKLIKEFQ